MKHPHLNMKDFCEQVANSLSYADRRLDDLQALAADMPAEVPPEVRNQLEKEAILLMSFTHLVVGACEGGVISREAMLSYVSSEYGRKGANRFERIFDGHAGCWERIKASAPKIDLPDMKGKPEND